MLLLSGGNVLLPYAHLLLLQKCSLQLNTREIGNLEYQDFSTHLLFLSIYLTVITMSLISWPHLILIAILRGRYH